MWLKAILLVVFLGATSGCTTYKVAMQSLSGCANSEKQPESYIRAKRMEKGIYVEVLDFYNCAYSQNQPKFSVVGSLGTLSIKSGNSDNIATACSCPHTYGFTIVGDARVVETVEYTVNGYKMSSVDVPTQE